MSTSKHPWKEEKGKLAQLKSVNQIAESIGVTPKTIWRWTAAGTFPKPIKLSGGSTRWRAEDVTAWMESKGVDA
jgi:prophage regulatory protein